MPSAATCDKLRERLANSVVTLGAARSAPILDFCLQNHRAATNIWRIGGSQWGFDSGVRLNYCQA